MTLAFHLRAVLVLDDAVGNESWFFCMMGKHLHRSDGRFTGRGVVRRMARLFRFLSAAWEAEIAI